MQFALMTVTAALGRLFGYDTGVISGAPLFVRTVFHLQYAGQSIVADIVLVSAVLGAIVARTLSDSLGRRRVILVSAPAFMIGALPSAVPGSVAMPLEGRPLIGIAIGVASMLRASPAKAASELATFHTDFRQEGSRLLPWSAPLAPRLRPALVIGAGSRCSNRSPQSTR
jgi:MFS family permease